MNDNTPFRYTRSVPRILRSLLWEPLVMASAVGDRYRQYRKWQAVIEAMRTGIRIGIEIEKRNHSASHTCSLLPGLQGDATVEPALPVDE